MCSRTTDPQSVHLAVAGGVPYTALRGYPLRVYLLRDPQHPNRAPRNVPRFLKEPPDKNSQGKRGRKRTSPPAPLLKERGPVCQKCAIIG
jgi:hypothetical protein